jgi:hypothetical protein
MGYGGCFAGVGREPHRTFVEDVVIVGSIPLAFG